MRAARRILASVFGLCLWSATSFAGSPAEEAFRQGRKAMDAGDIKTACEKFQESQKLEPAPGTLLNLADCEERAGRVVQASEHYRLAASGFGKTDQRRAFALDKASTTSLRIAKVTFKPDPALPADATVHVGDTVFRKFGEELPFDPGPLTVTVEAKGHDPKTTRLELEAGRKIEVVLEVGPEVRVTSDGVRVIVRESDKPATKSENTTQRTVGIVSMISGGVVLAVGTALGVYALDRGAVYGSHCNRTTNACDQEGLDAASSVSWLAPASTIAIVAGGAIGVAGVVLFLTAPHGSRAAPATGSISLSPTLQGLRLSGTF